MIYCRWNEWNVDHIAEHGVHPEEVEYVLQHCRAPWPERVGNEKFLVYGRTVAGEYLQVLFLAEPDDVVFVIHARPLTANEKHRFRRRTR